MKKPLLLGLCLLVSSSYGHPPPDAPEPIGRRLGLSLIEVIDSMHKEGLYRYSSYSADQPDTPSPSTNVFFRSLDGERVLCYNFEHDRSTFAMLLLPLAELDSVVSAFDRQFPVLAKQVWQGPHEHITVKVAIGKESVRSDHKPHVTVLFNPTK